MAFLISQSIEVKMTSAKNPSSWQIAGKLLKIFNTKVLNSIGCVLLSHLEDSIIHFTFSDLIIRLITMILAFCSHVKYKV